VSGLIALVFAVIAIAMGIRVFMEVVRPS